MKSHNVKIGKTGENKATAYLIRKGYKILERNYRSHHGEIDIIAQKDGITVFVEVKTRTQDTYGRPVEAVNFYKRKSIIAVSQMYLATKSYNSQCRFDVIEVILKKEFLGYSVKINHIENAFWEI